MRNSKAKKIKTRQTVETEYKKAGGFLIKDDKRNSTIRNILYYLVNLFGVLLISIGRNPIAPKFLRKLMGKAITKVQLVKDKLVKTKLIRQQYMCTGIREQNKVAKRAYKRLTRPEKHAITMKEKKRLKNTKLKESVSEA